MRKAFYSLMFCIPLFSYSRGNAQSFMVQSDTVRYTVYSSATIHNDVMNMSSSPIKFQWHVTDHNIPNAWQNTFGICDNNLCYTGADVLGTSSSSPATPPYTPPGSMHTTDTFSNMCDFHVQGDFNGLPNGGEYYVAVELTQGSTTKNVVFIINKWAASINDKQQTGQSTTIFPNPAKNQLTILTSNILDAQIIEVVNSIGQLVKKEQFTNKYLLDISYYSSGSYFVRLRDRNMKLLSTQKFIKE